MDTPGLVVSATILTASVAKMRKARGDLSMIISILPTNDSTECGINLISSMGFDNPLIQQIILVVLI
jgi:hypothetical protein